MRITRVAVRNLFGSFDHVIPLSMDTRITIVHSPNGYGKTTIFQLLNSIFNLNLARIRSVSFKDFSIDFDDGTRLVVSKKQRAKSVESSRIAEDSKEVSFRLVKSDGHRVGYHFPSYGKDSSRGELMLIERMELMRELDIRREKRDWSEEDLLRAEKRVMDINERVHSKLDRYVPEMPEELKEVLRSVPVKFIESQRLLQRSSNVENEQHDIPPRDFSRWRSVNDQHTESFVPSVTAYSDEVSKTMESLLAEYASKSQDLDRRFPSRLIKELLETDTKHAESKKTILRELQNLEEKRRSLSGVGMLDSGPSSPKLKERRIDNRTKKVLSLYIDDTKNKLSVFDNFESRVKLLRSIINSQFLFKSIEIRRGKGFVMKSDDGQTLEPKDLSSGEQHQLVLYYELLFKTKPSSLILIDEPEISLHVAWQQQLVRNLQDICTIIESDVILATHSPQVVHDRWDLAVELKGKSV